MTKIFKRLVCYVMVAIMMFSTVGMTTAFAAEIEPYAGVETFIIGDNYEVGGFTFTNVNTTPTKTVEGRYLYTYFEMKRASTDQGVATTPIKVTVEVLDASTLTRLGGQIYIINPGESISGGFEVDLSYTGRKICYRFDASSYNGTTNGYYRSATISRFMVNSNNTAGHYFDNN